MNRQFGAIFAISGLLIFGCGDDDGLPPAADTGPQPDSTALIDASPPDAPVNPDGPAIEVLSPSEPAAGDLSSAAIVTQARITVSCRASANTDTGTAVDSSSVVITAGSATGEERSAAASPTGVPDEFEAQLDVSDFPNGVLNITCTASDAAATPVANSDTNSTFLDLGPLVTYFTPLEMSSLAGRVDILFSVDAAEVAVGDSGASPNLAGVKLFVAGVELTTSLNGNVFSATAVFDDTVLFDPSLDGAQTIVVTAPNTRSAVPVIRTASRVFTADGAGPTIVVGGPVPGELIAGIVTFSATITDDAGVDPLSVVVTIGGTDEFPMVNTGGNNFDGSFDTRELGTGLVFPTVVIRARDTVGNQSALGYVVGLDNNPPVVSLDPPDVREAQEVDGLIECSQLFDPVGSDAVNDGMTIAQLSEFRARINDIGNGALATNSVLIPLAGVNDLSVQMYILDDAAGALIVDTNNDGVCDDINPLLVPTSVPMAANEAAVIDLVQVGETGNSFFEVPIIPYNSGLEAVCFPLDPSVDPPDAICGISSPATRIPKTVIGADAIIYAVPPLTEFQCLGNAFDSLATNIADGFACVAIRVEDNLGNVGISPPMRVCFDFDGSGTECVAGIGLINPGPLPDCTGTYNQMTDTVNVNMDCSDPVRFSDAPGFQFLRIDF